MKKFLYKKPINTKLKIKRIFLKKKKLREIFYLVLLMLSPLLTTQSYQLLI